MYDDVDRGRGHRGDMWRREMTVDLFGFNGVVTRALALVWPTGAPTA